MAKHRDGTEHARLSGYQEASKAVPGFRLPFSGFLRELHLSCVWSENDQGDVYAVDMLLATEAGGTPCTVRMAFEGVQGLALKEFDRHPQQVAGFDVVDMQADQWEGLYWHVEDYENGVMNFYARTARIVECRR